MLNSNKFPDVIESQRLEETVILTLHIAKDIAYFDGHFPSAPVLPGVAQLHWAVEFSVEHFGIPRVILGASQIKFSNIIKPLDEVQLVLEHVREKQQISYKYQGRDNAYSSGRFTYQKNEQTS